MSLSTLFSCEGRIAVVSGGAGRYGFAISEALAEAGATVIVASRNDRMFEAKTSQLCRPLRLSHRPLDLTSETSIAALFQGIRADFGRIDILVNNALTPVGGGLAETSVATWMKSAQGNIVSLYAMCREGAAAMEGGGGSIINISSIWGKVAPDYAAYAEAKSAPNPVDYGFIKGGMIMFTRTLASHLGPQRIRVNCIVPGGVSDETDNAEYVRLYARKVPLGRWAVPEDIKGAVVYLASDASAYVTGSSLTVDGGYTAL